MSAEAYPNLGLEHNYCRNDPSIASFGFESYPRRNFDIYGTWDDLVTTPAYTQTRTAPWRGMSKSITRGKMTPSQNSGTQHTAPGEHSQLLYSLCVRLETLRWCYVEPESAIEDEEVAWCHRARRQHGYLLRPADDDMWDCTSGICVAKGSGSIRQDWPICGPASNRSAFRHHNVDGCGWPWGSRPKYPWQPGLSSEEALQQAYADGLTLRAADDATGHLGVYYANPYYPYEERNRTRYFGVYYDTTYGDKNKPYKARVNGSGDLDDWGLHNSSELAACDTAEEAALAIARNAAEKEWRAHGCEARALRKEVRALAHWIDGRYE